MKILVLPSFGIGDTLLLTPALRLLRKKLVNSKITLISMFKTTYEVIRNIPYVNEIIFFPFFEKGRWESLKFVIGLRKKFDVSINFYPSNRIHYNIIAFLVGAEMRIGHRYIKHNIRSLNFLKNKTIKEDPEKHAVIENLDLLKFLDIEHKTEDTDTSLYYKIEDDEMKQSLDFLKEMGLEKKKLIGFHPGSSVYKNHIKKRWPVKKFAQLAENLLREVENSAILLFGGGEDRDAKEGIKNLVKRGVYDISMKNIRETAAIMAHCKVFVTNDSGLMHLAAALSIRTVALFGPTNPRWVGPWGVENKIITLGLPCSPCFYYSPKPMDCKAKLDYKCMRDIPVEDVLKATLEFL